jgi:hypothetical protein
MEPDGKITDPGDADGRASRLTVKGKTILFGDRARHKAALFAGVCQAYSTLLGFAEPITQFLSISGFDHSPKFPYIVEFYFKCEFACFKCEFEYNCWVAAAKRRSARRRRALTFAHSGRSFGRGNHALLRTTSFAAI